MFSSLNGFKIKLKNPKHLKVFDVRPVKNHLFVSKKKKNNNNFCDFFQLFWAFYLIAQVPITKLVIQLYI